MDKKALDRFLNENPPYNEKMSAQAMTHFIIATGFRPEAMESRFM